MKLRLISTTKPIIARLLKKTPPDFSAWDVWMVDNVLSRSEPPSPNVCQMPDIAKNKSIGAKMHPKYKWRDRSFCMLDDGD